MPEDNANMDVVSDGWLRYYENLMISRIKHKIQKLNN